MNGYYYFEVKKDWQLTLLQTKMMKKLYSCKAVWFVLLLPMFCFAQNIGNQGKDFWVGNLKSQNTFTINSSQKLKIYLSAGNIGDTVRITIREDSPTMLYKDYWVLANAFIASDELIDSILIGAGLRTKSAIHITSKTLR